MCVCVCVYLCVCMHACVCACVCVFVCVCYQRNLRLYVCLVGVSIHTCISAGSVPPYLLPLCVSTFLSYANPPSSPSPSLSRLLSACVCTCVCAMQPLSITLSACVYLCVCPRLCTFVYTYLITQFFKSLFLKTAHGSYLSTTFSFLFFPLFPLPSNPADRSMNTTGPTA